VLSLVDGRLRAAVDVAGHTEWEKYLDVSAGLERTRAMVKAQDGCDSHCTYCIIPRARGRSRSVPPEEVLRRVRSLVQEGHAEIVITGVDLGSYGAEEETLPDLGGLLRCLLEGSEVQRIRVSSLEPGDFQEHWLELWDTPRLCRHLHVPLQAGSAGVLQRMDRSYTPQRFADMVATCRSAIPGLTVTTDIITGFPGETQEEFEDGFAFIRAMSFDGMHVFKYSRRSGTRAAHMPGQVPEKVKSERSALLRQEALAGASRLAARHRGTIASVAWESERDGIRRGLTDTNVRVYGPDGWDGGGRLERVTLAGPFRDGLWSEPAQVEIPLVSVS
jgi:threonylcarbamoyladenosine tRNA methylthiotransferase MtaB